MKKNIVLVTWIGNGNYGTSLQSFALHRKLEMLGYKVSFLQNFPNNFGLKYKVKNILRKLGIDTKKNKETIKPQKQTLKQRKLADFISKNYNFYKPILSKRNLNELKERTDVFLTGSDQIWNTAFRFTPFYFLDFVGDSKCIAYASSIGLNDFPDQHKPIVKELLSKFSHIGLREKTAVDIVSKLLGRDDVVQVLDPTFLLNKNEWADISDKATIEIKLPKKFIFSYLIGKNSWYKEQLGEVVAATGIKDVIIVPAAENADFSIEGATVYNNAGPLEFVKLIKESTFVCTDSFHATAISINLNKDFVEFMRFKDSDKVSQNSRIYDVLNHYQLMNRIYSDKTTEWSDSIDFKYSNMLLEEDRKYSLDYLVNAIKN